MNTSTPHTNALEAWNYLCTHAGLEVEARDEGLAEKIHELIDPSASSFEEAIKSASLEIFLSAFFRSVHPYLSMFEDILAFFKQASATKGQDQWTLHVGDIGIDLDHFREYTETWSSLGKSAVMFRGIDYDSAWKVYGCFNWRNLVSDGIVKEDESAWHPVSAEVQAWIDAFHRGIYTPLPEELHATNAPDYFADVCLIVQVAVDYLVSLGLPRRELVALYKERVSEGAIKAVDKEDAFTFSSLVHSESDDWLLGLIIGLSRAIIHLSPSEQESLGQELEAITQPFPLRPAQVSASTKDLESLLSLPIWKQRYELYSVWIATEIIKALKGHKIDIHHDNGSITFSFKETVIATILSSPGPFSLVSERKSPLANPIGESRKGNVQPDHALWTTDFSEEACRLVIEVKHYKRSAKRPFIEVFEDYARAHPEADIYLVNHGPVGKAAEGVSYGIRGRCYAIGNLTSSNLAGRKTLADVVRKTVGEPFIDWADEPENSDDTHVLLIDVSGSMKHSLRSQESQFLIQKLIEDKRPAKLIAANDKIVGTWPATKAGVESLFETGGGGTYLNEVIRALQPTAESIILVTDKEGYCSINDDGVQLHHLHSSAPAGYYVCVIKSDVKIRT